MIEVPKNGVQSCSRVVPRWYIFIGFRVPVESKETQTSTWEWNADAWHAQVDSFHWHFTVIKPRFSEEY